MDRSQADEVLMQLSRVERALAQKPGGDAAREKLAALQAALNQTSPAESKTGAAIRALAAEIKALAAANGLDPCVTECFDQYFKDVEACDGDFWCEIDAQKRLDNCLAGCDESLS